MNGLPEIKQRLLEAAGACGKAKSSSEETFGFTKENGGGTGNRLDLPCRLSKVFSHLEGPVGNLGKLWHARGHESEF